MKLAFWLALLGAGGHVFAAETIYGGPSVIPHLVDGDGWKTIITVVNLDDTAASFTLKFYGDDGLPVVFSTTAGTSGSITGTIEPRGSSTIETCGTTVALTPGMGPSGHAQYGRRNRYFPARHAGPTQL